MTQYLLSIDQGTTSSRAIIFTENGERVAIGQHDYAQHYPRDGWVEHEPEDIWRTTITSCRDAIKAADIKPQQIASIGITNQRETTVIWDRRTGQPVHRAIVWQDRRTAAYCSALREKLEKAGQAGLIQQKTGLLLDAYFSASKIVWLLDNIPGARQAAEQGDLAFGTIDSYLLWHLTAGKLHATDATNASRTMLFNIHTQQWDQELLELFGIPEKILPQVKDCADNYGFTTPELFGHSIPIGGMMGDQQAAAFGQACFEPGMTKSTYGTGCFLLMNSGKQALTSRHNLLTTVAFRLNGETHYALEGSIFMAGATMQWLRDKLRLFSSTAETEALAAQADPGLSVMLVPAFTGLGAPWWDPDARGAIFGLTRDAGIPEIVAAALMSVAYQTKDLQKAMEADGQRPNTLRVDGGMAANGFAMQQLADLLGCQVDRPEVTETTALGAAFVAGLQAGIYHSLQQISALWKLEHSFAPEKDKNWRDQQYNRWLDAVNRTRTN
ncbi:glycerol kinase GlpK [Pseudohongiella spirulinae]|uniref:Glycerol kinase n=1 Tax=Pseudohongiella spirulinae TaxID=1249552 RepID=A0A0S2KG10_9GAMM|nr:glycerol kinase GlpK [Pseudohongiella spirulinae]ALO47059.1 Glycerol kinase [Pseudohongiella spirulinae]